MVVDGVELLRMIRDGEIENGTKFINPKNQTNYICQNNNLYRVCSGNNKQNIFGGNVFSDIEYFGNYEFKILSEEDKEIDIQSIEEINIWSGYNRDDAQNIAKNTQKINELIKAIKQIDEKIK